MRCGGRDGSSSGGEYRVYSGALLVLNKQGGFAFLSKARAEEGERGAHPLGGLSYYRLF